MLCFLLKILEYFHDRYLYIPKSYLKLTALKFLYLQYYLSTVQYLIVFH
nr:MAG TPA: hypothetical protein [Caudoviricetes sp.]